MVRIELKCIICFVSDHGIVRIMSFQMSEMNGLCFAPDGSRLYIIYSLLMMTPRRASSLTEFLSEWVFKECFKATTIFKARTALKETEHCFFSQRKAFPLFSPLHLIKTSIKKKVALWLMLFLSSSLSNEHTWVLCCGSQAGLRTAASQLNVSMWQANGNMLFLQPLTRTHKYTHVPMLYC